MNEFEVISEKDYPAKKSNAWLWGLVVLIIIILIFVIKNQMKNEKFI